MAKEEVGKEYKGVIYKVTCTKNGKCYIGQTIEYSARKARHKSDCFNINSPNHNCALYRAMRKHGWENFNFSILETHICSTKQELKDTLNIREELLIQKFDSFLNGYNSNKGGKSRCGYRRTQEQIEKSAEARRIPVVQYMWNGSMITEWDALRDAQDATGASEGNICNCCNGIRKTAGGYVWRYKGDAFDKYDSFFRKKARPIVQLTIDGKLVNKWDTIQSAAKHYGISDSNISGCCRGKKPHLIGFKWMYKEDYHDQGDS